MVKQDIALNLCVKPMLASSRDPVEIPALMGVNTTTTGFIMEPKMDGERLQIHWNVDTQVYSLYSRWEYLFFQKNIIVMIVLQIGYSFDLFSAMFCRQATNYTERYGPRFARFLQTNFTPVVRNIILDGELLTYDKELGEFLKFGQAKTVGS
jgi:ATP-dependent DNA ligase